MELVSEVVEPEVDVSRLHDALAVLLLRVHEQRLAASAS